MKTILGHNTAVGTSLEDIATGTIGIPTAARIHAIVSDDAVDDNTTQAQIETATSTGTVTTSGNADVIVTSAGMAGSPKTVNVAVLQGTDQVETQTIVGTADSDGDINVVVTGVNVTGSPLTVPVTVVGGVLQVETATVVGTVATAGDIDFILTSAILVGSPLTTKVTVDAGVAQVETATTVGTIDPAGAGNAEVVITGALIAGSPLTVQVAVANDDTASDVGGKIRAALTMVAITNNYTVSGATTDVILTADAFAADDATLNISIDNGTCTGLTAAPTSVDTVAGNAVDDSDDVAAKAITALNLVAAITDDYTVSGDEGSGVIVTAKVKAANDATMNLAYANDTATGVVDDATSVDTVAGVVADTASDVGGKVRTALGIAAITDEYAVSGATTDIILTTDDSLANDATLNIAYDNGTATGLTPDTTSVNTVAGVAADTDNTIATKIRAALVSDAAIGHPSTGKFTITGSTNDIILTANTIAINDATLNVNIADGTSVGVDTAATSVNTQAGSLGTGAHHVIIRGISGNYIYQEETVYLNGIVAVNTVNSYRFINEMEITSGDTNVGVITATAATDGTVTCAIAAGSGAATQAFYMATDDGSAIDRLTSLYADSMNATGDAYTTLLVKIKYWGSDSWAIKWMQKLDDNRTSLDAVLDLQIPRRAMVKVAGIASAGSANVTCMMGIE